MGFIILAGIGILLLLVLMIHIQLESNRLESEITILAEKVTKHYDNQ